MTTVFATKRLVVREVHPDDVGFILKLVNDPDWLRHIGDRNVRSLGDARRYLEDGPLSSYREHGFGLWSVTVRNSGLPIGLCGFLKRETLDEPDLGYAFLPAYRKQGYAMEACVGALEYAAQTLERSRILAIVSPDNEPSIRLLLRLGFVFDRRIDFGDEGETAHLYSTALCPPNQPTLPC